MTLYGARKIALAIRDYTKEKSKEPTGNQNCLLCTWCAEAQFRGINILPRPVYSPRDSIFTHTGRGLDIVYNPKKQSVSNITDLKSRCLSSHQDSRYYCHVNWNGSTGGHEFLLLIIDGKIYVMDAQQGIVTDIGSEKGMYYFNDINWSNTFIARIDDKNLNKSLLMKENDPKNTLPWNPDKDIPYMKEQGMIPDADHVMRDATDDDLEFVYFSELETVGENKNDLKVQKYIRQDAKESIGHTKIIVVDGEDVGVYQAYATNEWGLREGKKDWWYLAHIYIKPAYRGLGIGSNIIKQDIRNHDKILLQVMKSNKRAIKLYKSLGFKFSQENDHGGIVMRYEKSKSIQESSMDEYTNPISKINKFFDSMKDFEYGFYADGKVYTGDILDKPKVFDNYHLMSSEEIEQYKVCVCWDACRYEAEWFKNNLPNVEIKVYYCEYEPKIGNTHTWLMFKLNDHWYVFEYTWYNKRGIKETTSLDAFVDEYIKAIPEHEHSPAKLKNAKYVLIEYDPLQDKPGLSCVEFMDRKWHNGTLIKTNCKSEEELINTFEFTNEKWKPKFEINPIQETYIDYNDSLISVEKYKFNTVYFGTQNRLTKTININQQLFVTPYKGIASIFSADNGVKKKLFELGIFSSNMSYDEWNKTSGLDNLFKIVHIKVKVFIGRPFEKFEVDGKGYVYEIDITNLKNNIFIYDWMTKSREVLIANIDQVPIKSTYETNIKYIVEMENDLDNISSNEIFRVEYDENHVGIYEALKQAMIKAGKPDEWKRFLQLDAVKKLPEPPEYKDGYQSWFSSKGKREVWDKVKDIFYKYLDEKKFVYMVKSLKDWKGGKIIYSDKYQYVIDTKDDSIQEEFIEEAYRDSHFNKLYFHLSPESYLDGQVFKPRVPEYLDRYDPEDKNFENDTTPRVCFSPSIEGCLNGIMVNMPRVNVMPKTRFYVYTTEKPFHEYKHKTNKELIRDKDIFDASVTDEVWILEPVRLKLYGVIEIDSVYNVKRKQNVPTVSGKKSTRPYYKYKWHWLVKPKVLEKSTRYDYSLPKVIDNLCYELPKFKYGLIRNGKLQSGNVSESDYNKYWVVHSPTEIDQAGGGNCYDMVEWEADYLESYGVNYNKYYVALVKGERNETHTFIVVKDNGRYIYIEQAFKRVVDEIGNSKEFDKLEDIFKYVIECMCEFNNYSNWNYETIWDYTDIKFKVGTPMKNFTEYITTNGDIVYEGDVNNKSKTKKE